MYWQHIIYIGNKQIIKNYAYVKFCDNTICYKQLPYHNTCTFSPSGRVKAARDIGIMFTGVLLLSI